jgi:hypothetical protein
MTPTRSAGASSSSGSVDHSSTAKPARASCRSRRQTSAVLAQSSPLVGGSDQQAGPPGKLPCQREPLLVAGGEPPGAEPGAGHRDRDGGCLLDRGGAERAPVEQAVPAAQGRRC